MCVFQCTLKPVTPQVRTSKQAGYPLATEDITDTPWLPHICAISSIYMLALSYLKKHFPTSKNTWINKIRNLKRSGVEVKSVVALATGKACCNNTVRQNCPTCTFSQLHICTSASCLQCNCNCTNSSRLQNCTNTGSCCQLMLQGNGANTCSTCYPNVYSNAHLKSLPEKALKM